MRGAPAAGIVKGDVVKDHLGRHLRWHNTLCGVLYHRRTIQEGVDAFGCRQANHALMQNAAQFAHWSVHFHPEHQDDQEGL